MTKFLEALSRRKFLRWVASVGTGIALVSTLGGCNGTNGGSRNELPNILIVLVDDLAVDVMGESSRFPFFDTPNVDRLIDEGVQFTNAFVSTSLCSPSRASLLTGVYAHRHGVRGNNGAELDPTMPSFPELLQARGYETAFIGKWHMLPRLSDPRPGFDYWLSFKGQGVYIDPALNENGVEFQAQGYMTDLLTDYALRWLRQPREKPFCLIISHKAAHAPFIPAERHKDTFSTAELPKPPNFDDTFEGKPEWLRRLILCGMRRSEWRACEGEPIPDSIPPSEWNNKHVDFLNYLRTLLAVDEGLGSLLHELANFNKLDDTFFVFTSDNGFFLGEHRLRDKRLMYYESIRIPLVIRYPELAVPASTIQEMVLNFDLAPTILELAHLSIPDNMQGRSFLPLIKGQSPKWRTSFLYEYFQEGFYPAISEFLNLQLVHNHL